MYFGLAIIEHRVNCLLSKLKQSRQKADNTVQSTNRHNKTVTLNQRKIKWCDAFQILLMS